MLLYGLLNYTRMHAGGAGSTHKVYRSEGRPRSARVAI